MKILLLGCGGNAGINFTKCIHKSTDYEVVGVDMNKYYLDSSNADYKEQIILSYKKEEILRLIDKYDIKMIHAQPDPEVKYLLSTPELKPYTFNHDLNLLNRFENKLDCQKIWSTTIKPFTTCSFQEAKENPALFSEMLYKGNGKVWVRCMKGAGSKAALPVQTIEQAANWISYWREIRSIPESDFMLCQFLPGKEYAVQTFWLNGELVHSQARERLIYFFGALMPSGQTSTPAVAKTISDVRPYATAYKAIYSIDPNPHGIYCVDMKEDFEGDPIPTEVNYGRFFTTSDFFAELGVNTPLEYVKSFTDKDYIPNYKINRLDPSYFWIRGLDKLPKLIKYEPFI